ncbi:MAG: hypothetical protein ACR2PI_04075 [Hyphomicrobiaceae bacterium]
MALGKRMAMAPRPKTKFSPTPRWTADAPRAPTTPEDIVSTRNATWPEASNGTPREMLQKGRLTCVTRSPRAHPSYGGDMLGKTDPNRVMGTEYGRFVLSHFFYISDYCSMNFACEGFTN